MKTSDFAMIHSRWLLLFGLCLGLGPWPGKTVDLPYYQITVNSNRDEIRADAFLTLREAIAIINGQLTLSQLSPAERQQVITTKNENRVDFRLPIGQQRILLQSDLPSITTARLVIDGRSDINTGNATIQDLTFRQPTVEITPAPGQQIKHGLVLVADNITVTGLSLYGFQTGDRENTQNIPAADILIGGSAYPQLDDRPAPQNIVIENNFLGVQSDRTVPVQTSDFGVYVFNSQGTTVRHNAIGYHSASGIISQVNANNLLVENNAIFGNGTQGMPDAIRLEGRLINNRIQNNLICGNDGSGIYIFKPDTGAVTIADNRLQSNGRRLRRAAIYLMGNDHQVINNTIEFQAGAGVVVTAFAPTDRADLPGKRNIILNNRFQQLEGLSIDLITYRNAAVEDFQNGDGVNPQRNSENRRLDTGNGAINAPQFLAREFYRIGDRVNLDGLADPGSQVQIYQVNVDRSDRGPLSQPITTVITDARGRFQATLSGVSPGTTLSAIATDRRYGTSEPAVNVLVTIPGQTIVAKPLTVVPPDCSLQNLPAATPIVAVAKSPLVPPVPKRIAMARSIHFALDKSNLSSASVQILNQIVQVLQVNPYISVDLSGYTDPRAPQNYNQALGLRRAMSVRNYLMQQGIAPQRMTIRSFGETKRRSNERGAYPYALDRRVEIEYRDLRGVELEIIDRLDDLQLEK